MGLAQGGVMALKMVIAWQRHYLLLMHLPSNVSIASKRGDLLSEHAAAQVGAPIQKQDSNFATQSMHTHQANVANWINQQKAP